MRAFFYLLLLTNLVFLLLQWAYPYEQWAARPGPSLAAAERLRLLDEPVTLAVQEDGGGVKARTTRVDEKIEANQLCYTLGPFKDQVGAQEAARRLRDSGVQVAVRASQEQEYTGMMVYLGPHESRRQAIDLSRELAAKGIRDQFVFNEPGHEFALSLGVFGLKKNAQRLMARLKKLGYSPKAESRYRQSTIYWLDYSKPESQELQQWIASLSNDQGISRITRQCP